MAQFDFFPHFRIWASFPVSHVDIMDDSLAHQIKS